MKKLAFVLLAVAFCGCGTLNSPSEPNRSTLQMKKCCGCNGMEHCKKNPDGSTCCKVDDCSCNQVTVAQGCATCGH